MRLAAVLLVSSLTVAASAQAAPTVQHAGQTPEETTKYWTKERMRSAIPRDVVRGGEPRANAKPGGAGGGGGTTWTRLAVPMPYSGADLNSGKVFFTIDDANYVCSGTSVAAGASVDLVWTAGHCVTDGPGHEASKFTFVPGYLDGAAPHGKWGFTQVASTSQWSNNGNFEYDFGAVRVGPGEGAPPSGTLDQVATPRPMAFNYPVTTNSTRFKSYGYPAAGKFNGQRMYVCDSAVRYRDASAMGIGCDMTGGSSGGGWVTSGGAVGSVNSYGYQSLKNVMFGPYQGSVAQSLYGSMD